MTAYWTHRRTAAHRDFRAARDVLLRYRREHDRACAEFRWPRPATFNWALEWFDVVASGNRQPALVLPDTRTTVSYARLSSRSDTVAVWLAEHGVRRGDRVLIVLDPRPELWECLLACLKLGAVAVPTYTTATPVEVDDRLRRGRIAHLVCAPQLVAPYQSLPVPGLRVVAGPAVPGWLGYPAPTAPHRPYQPDGPTPAGSVAFGYFTSGTTATPKLVEHTHASYPIGHLSSLYWNGIGPGDRHLNLSAPGWAKHSWSSLFVPFTGQATVLALPHPPDPGALPDLLCRYRASSLCAAPSLWRQLVGHLGRARPALREATSAGEPLDPELAARIGRAWGVPVRDGYGQTETTALIGTTPGLVPRPGWLGRPLPGYRITLRDPLTGVPGDTGEICVELAGGPVGVSPGCLPGATATRAGAGAVRVTGWYGTGDLARRDAGGWIRVLGRRDDVFKSGGHRVSPYEVEAALREHPGVAEVAVIPHGDPVTGLVPVAVVQASGTQRPDDRLAAQLLAYAADRLPPHSRPCAVRFVTAMPRTASGKLRRSALRERG